MRTSVPHSRADLKNDERALYSQALKRLAYITYEFPPRGSTQSQHTAAIAEGLSRLGWEVVVFTVADPPSSMVDLEAAERLGAIVEIRRSYSAEPTRLIQWIGRMKAWVRTRQAGQTQAAVAPGARGVSGLPTWAIRLVQAFFLPDEKIGWRSYAMADIEKAHAVNPFDAVLVSGPPWTALAIGLSVRKRLSRLWVADLRDPLINGYWFNPPTPLHRWWMERFERRVVDSASRVVTATAWIADELKARHPDRADIIEVLPNGFSKDVFEGLAPLDDGRFTIAYVGTFQVSIQPDTLLDAIVALGKKGSPVLDDLRVRFVGAKDPRTEEAIIQRGLDDVIERTGFISQRAAYQAMIDADVLMITLGPEPASAGILTSKLPEYLGSGRSVLALVPDGVAASAVTRAGAGSVVPSRNVEATVTAIEDLHARWRRGDLPSPDPAVVAEFDRDRVISRFSALLESAASDVIDRC